MRAFVSRLPHVPSSHAHCTSKTSASCPLSWPLRSWYARKHSLGSASLNRPTTDLGYDQRPSWIVGFVCEQQRGVALTRVGHDRASAPRAQAPNPSLSWPIWSGQYPLPPFRLDLAHHQRKHVERQILRLPCPLPSVVHRLNAQ